MSVYVKGQAPSLEKISRLYYGKPYTYLTTLQQEKIQSLKLSMIKIDKKYKSSEKSILGKRNI